LFWQTDSKTLTACKKGQSHTQVKCWIDGHRVLVKKKPLPIGKAHIALPNGVFFQTTCFCSHPTRKAPFCSANTCLRPCATFHTDSFCEDAVEDWTTALPPNQSKEFVASSSHNTQKSSG